MTDAALPVRLVYRRFESPEGDALVFSTPMRAELVDRWQRAALESITWGEFRQAVGPIEAESIDRAGFDDLNEPRPANTDPFDYQQVPGYEDGDWPPWLAAEMDRVVPRSVLERFGQRLSSVHNGGFWHIPGHLEEVVIRALHLGGVSVERRDDLCFH